jgi:hypothetical protein
MFMESFMKDYSSIAAKLNSTTFAPRQQISSSQYLKHDLPQIWAPISNALLKFKKATHAPVEDFVSNAKNVTSHASGKHNSSTSTGHMNFTRSPIFLQRRRSSMAKVPRERQRGIKLSLTRPLT